ncbi:MAG: LysM peptidoglycan-binding domain-containing protein [Actinobacteria bacterium]|nr:LysM peptidoglycan-binding domain-containing protein [Actinomycetota bacterium]
MTTLRNLTRTLGAVAAVAGLVVGIPVALAVGIGWPLPRTVPSLEELGRVLSGSAISDQAIVAVLAAVLWIAWLILVGCVAVEIVRAARGHQVRIPVAGTFARWVVASMTLASSLVGARPALAAVVPYSAAAVVVDHSPEAPAEASPAPARPAPAGAEDGGYLVVQPGATLWDIAEETVGDPFRWPELFQLNVGVEQPDGRWLRKPDLIRPGWRLKLPADAVVSPATPTSGESQDVPAPSETPIPDPAPNQGPVAPRLDAPPPAVTTTTTVTSAPETEAEALPIPDPGRERPPLGSTPATAPAQESVEVMRPLVPAPTTTSTSAPPGDRGEPQLVGTPPLPDPTAPRPTPRNVTTEPSRPDEKPSTPASEGRRGGQAGDVLEELPIPMGSQGLLGAALLGAGVVSVLKLRRGVQLRHRRPGTRIPLAEDELASAELALRAGADPDGAAFVDVALRALTRAVQTEGLQVPRILGVQLGLRELEVVLGEPMAPAPEPFVARAGGKRWTLVRPGDLDELEDLTAEVPAPLPALVTLGTDETSGSRVLYDLEAPGLTCLTGDTDVAREVLYAAAAELATSSYGEYYSLVLVGFGEGLASLERVRVVSSLGEVIDDLERDATDVGQLLAESELGSTVEGRLLGVGVDAWAPTVVLCARVPPTRLARRLAALGTHPDNAGVAILVAGDVKGATTRLEIDGDHLDVGPMETTVTSQRLSRDEAAAVGELLELVVDDDTDGPYAFDSDLAEAEAHEPGLSAVDDDTDGPDAFDSDRQPGAQEWADEERQDEGPASGAESWFTEGSKFFPTGAPAVVEPEVMARVLGPVDIIRGEESVSIERGKSVELVVYLATHREGLVDTDVVMEALWPGKERNSKTLNTTTTTARTALGKDSEGLLYLPRISGGGDRLYRISKRVRLDYEVFMELVAAAASQEPRDAIVTLRRALALVRGRPFEVLGGYEWAHVGLATRMAEDVADAAHRMARLCLAADDPEGARWAAHKGLLASQGNEVLFCDRMDAEKLSGNLAGVRAIMEELHALAGAEEPYGGIHPDTVAHFKELTAAGR